MSQDQERLPITKPVFGAREAELILKPLQTGWVVQGPYVKQFEDMFADFSGISHALAVSNCTTALHLVLAAWNLGPGDEVIVPSFTYIASANAVEYTGAKPVFCDIDRRRFVLNPDMVEPLITSRTKAIIPVSLFGLSVEMGPLMELASSYGIKVLEDAACAFGSRYQGDHAGSLAHAAAFSFHPRKAITTGEGGMIVTNDGQLAAHLAMLRNHGAQATDLERHFNKGGSLLPAFKHLGFNYRLTDLQGALGVAQMEKAESILAARRLAAQKYHELLSGQELVLPPLEPPGHRHAYQSYVVLYTLGKEPDLANLDELNRLRNRKMAALEAQGISVRQGTHAVHTLDYYAGKYGLKPQDFPASLLADRLSITLPLYPGLTESQQCRVAEALLKPEG